MIAALELIGAMTWDPGFKGVLTVALSVAILCGSVALIIGTNSGARLGFLIALAGFMGWNLVMGIIWAVYGIGWVGPSPSWQYVDTVTGPTNQTRIEVAHDLVLPGELPDPLEIRDSSEELQEAFPDTARDPNLTDLVSFDEDLREEIDGQIGEWTILDTANGYTGETQSVVTEAMADQGTFESASDYIVRESFITGGKSRRTDDSIVGRVIYKVKSAFEFTNDPFLAAVQIQAVVPQEAKPGQAPPLPVADADAPVHTVILERDRGSKRLPAVLFTAASGLVFGLSCYLLHTRDKLATEQRAASPAGA